MSDPMTIQAQPLKVTPQGLDTLHMTTDSLDIGRGVAVSVNGHVFRGPDGWQFARPDAKRSDYFGNPHVSRGWDKPDASRAMIDRVKAAMIAAADAYVAEYPDALQDAQRAQSEADARERRALAVKLRAQADALDVEADALEAGGKVVSREHSYGSGFRDNVRHVMTADGDLLPSLPEVTVYHAHRYGPRLPSENA